MKQERPSKKLSDKNAGPFQIIRKVGHAFKLQLPPEYDIHPIFTPEKLRRAHKPDRKPLIGQLPNQAQPVKIAGEDE